MSPLANIQSLADTLGKLFILASFLVQISIVQREEQNIQSLKSEHEVVNLESKFAEASAELRILSIATFTTLRNQLLTEAMLNTKTILRQEEVPDAPKGNTGGLYGKIQRTEKIFVELMNEQRRLKYERGELNQSEIVLLAIKLLLVEEGEEPSLDSGIDLNEDVVRQLVKTDVSDLLKVVTDNQYETLLGIYEEATKIEKSIQNSEKALNVNKYLSYFLFIVGSLLSVYAALSNQGCRYNSQRLTNVASSTNTAK